jgi:hypothetical protein
VTGRGRAFVAVAAAAVTLGGGYVAWAASQGARDEGTPEPSARALNADGRGVVVFRNLDREHPERYGTLAYAPLDRPDASRSPTTMRCERIDFAGGRGICLTRSAKLGSLYAARIVDDRLATRHLVSLAGIPSRARISPDGRYGAVTTFVSGHSYATTGTFSTKTVLIDLASGRVLADLEQFQVQRDGHTVDAPDVNFWGVTFTRGGGRFYATLASGGRTYLIEGSVASRRARTLRENVECPALSPDDRRVAYKKRIVTSPGTPAVWQLHVLDLATGREARLAETRVIDDQVEWLDDTRILYRVDEEVWTVPADGSGVPARYLRAADSPAVMRAAGATPST